MGLFDKIYRKNISSDKLGRQILGALFQWQAKPFWAFILLIVPLSAGLSRILSPESWTPCLFLLGLNLVVCLVIKVCRTLTNIFSLNRNDGGITVCQIVMLAAIGFWVIGFVLIFDIRNNGRVAAAIGIIGAVLGWILQERVKSVAAFIHLRRHKLLNIGDWIKVPKLEVDGVVRKVTLTSVTLYNWDTTTSTVPISALQAEHFVNLQNMLGGKTYGRQMLKSFILDTEWIRPLSEADIGHLLSAGQDIRSYLPDNELRAGALNARLYRLYLYHWLMANPCISHSPRMLVRWLEHRDSGMALQVYAYITDTETAAFEWQQSQLIEHILASMEWFGLRLYQKPSAFDARNGNIYISDKPAQTGAEDLQ